MEDLPGGERRLKPEMASRKLLVLDFVRDYIGRWGDSPSYGEIAAALGTNRMRVRDAVKKLVREGRLVQHPGPRGLALPGVTDPTLPPRLRVDYLPESGATIVTGGKEAERASSRQSSVPAPGLGRAPPGKGGRGKPPQKGQPGDARTLGPQGARHARNP